MEKISYIQCNKMYKDRHWVSIYTRENLTCFINIIKKQGGCQFVTRSWLIAVTAPMLCLEELTMSGP